MSSDLPTFRELVEALSNIGNIVVAVFAVWAFFLAKRGVNQWREEMKSSAKLEVGRKIVSSARRFGREMRGVREPAVYANEVVGRQGKQTELRWEKEALDDHYAIKKRLKVPQRTLQRLHEACWEASFIYEEDLEALLEPLTQAYGKLNISIDRLLNTRIALQGRRPSSHDGQDVPSRDERIVYYMGDYDEFGRSLEEFIEALVDPVQKAVSL